MLLEQQENSQFESSVGRPGKTVPDTLSQVDVSGTPYR
jgi:hypothetical protein